MAEATITHFKEFDHEAMAVFGEKVRLTVGEVVYGFDLTDVPADAVTVIVSLAGPGSSTSATASSEVKVDLAEEQWEIVDGLRVDAEAAIAKAQGYAHAIGARLVGGVTEVEGANVNVWVRQFAATGWHCVPATE